MEARMLAVPLYLEASLERFFGQGIEALSLGFCSNQPLIFREVLAVSED